MLQFLPPPRHLALLTSQRFGEQDSTENAEELKRRQLLSLTTTELQDTEVRASVRAAQSGCAKTAEYYEDLATQAAEIRRSRQA